MQIRQKTKFIYCEWHYDVYWMQQYCSFAQILNHVTLTSPASICDIEICF